MQPDYSHWGAIHLDRGCLWFFCVHKTSHPWKTYISLKKIHLCHHHEHLSHQSVCWRLESLDDLGPKWLQNMVTTLSSCYNFCEQMEKPAGKMGYGNAAHTVSITPEDDDIVFTNALPHFVTAHKAMQTAIQQLTQTNRDLQQQLNFITSQLQSMMCTQPLISQFDICHAYTHVPYNAPPPHQAPNLGITLPCYANWNYSSIHDVDVPDGQMSNTCCKLVQYYVWNADCSNYHSVSGTDINMHKDQFSTFDTTIRPSYYWLLGEVHSDFALKFESNNLSTCSSLYKCLDLTPLQTTSYDDNATVVNSNCTPSPRVITNSMN